MVFLDDVEKLQTHLSHSLETIASVDPARGLECLEEVSDVEPHFRQRETLTQALLLYARDRL